MRTGRLVRWCKAIGELVEIGDVIAEIETDKAVIQMESANEGYLRQIVVLDDTANVEIGVVIGYLTDTLTESISIDRAIDKSAVSTSTQGTTTVDMYRVGGHRAPADIIAAQEESMRREAEQVKDKRISERILISPYAKLLAQEANVDWTKVRGTGRLGSITHADIKAYISTSSTNDVSRVHQSARHDSSVNKVNHAHKEAEIIELDAIRTTIARKTVHSLQTAAHFYVARSINMTNLLAYKSRLTTKTTVNDWIILAVAKTLLIHPNFNRTWIKDGVTLQQHIDTSINCAMDVGFGPILPCVRTVHTLSAIRTAMIEITQNAKDKRPLDHSIAGFSISNLGMYGVLQFNAVINHPQVAMLAVGCTDDNNKCIYTLACDHRALDGKDAGVFLRTLAELLEDPIHMLL